MKEQEPQPPGFVEGIGIKSALWFEGKLDEWSKPPTIQLSSHKRSKKGLVTLAGLGTATLLLGLAYYHESSTGKILPQPFVPRASLPIPRPIEAKPGEIEALISSMHTVATFRGGMVLNYVEGVQMSMFPLSLESLSLDPRVGINLPPNKQGFSFVLPIKEIEKPSFKRMMEDENERRSLLAEYDRQQDLKAQGIRSGRIHNVAIPFYEILRRVYQNQPSQDMPIGCFYRLVELEMALSWVVGMKAVILDFSEMPILGSTLSNDAISIIGNSRPLPFRVYSIEPNLIEEALGLSYGTLKISGSCG